MDLIRAVIFDLDDTLYLEKEYVYSGFRHVATVLESLAVVPAERLFPHLWGLFTAGVRRDTFDRLLGDFPELAHQVTVLDLVTAYRSHVPQISPLPGWLDLFTALKAQGYRLGLLSDGFLISQRAKVNALGLRRCLSPIVLTDRWGRDSWKPSPKGFQYLERKLSLHGEQLLYIGDNPGKDFVSPRRLGWTTIRFMVPGQLSQAVEPFAPEFAPHFTITRPEELQQILRNR